jgi:alpha-ribazole phosphatase
MRFILIRHTETVSNYEKKYIGWSTSKYTDKGIKDIIKIEEHIKNRNIKIDKIYCSPFDRTKNIASRLATMLDLDFSTDKSLSEINFGIFDNKTYKEIVNKYPEEVKDWTNDYINYVIPEGESLINMHNRVCCFIDKLKDENSTYIIVTHGGVIQSIITHILELPIEDRWKFKVGNGTVVELEYVDGYGILNEIINIRLL